MDCGADTAEIAAEFHRQHETLFGYKSVEMPIEVLAARLTVVGETPKAIGAGSQAGAEDGDLAAARLDRRPIWSLEREEFVEAEVYDGGLLPASANLRGPVIVELGTSTMVVHEGYELSIHESGSYVLTADGGPPGGDRLASAEAARMITDAHTHLYDASHASELFMNAMGGKWGQGWPRLPEVHAEAMKDVDRVVVLAFNTPAAGFVVPNDYVADATQDDPQLVGYGSVDPHDPTPSTS